MLRNLNNFLKHSERILSEMNNSRKDIFNKGIIRNMKYSQMVSNSQKYGNYFLDASLQSHNLPTFEGCEGDLYINAAYLAVYSLHERSLRKFVSELVDIDNELIDNTGQIPIYAHNYFRELSHGESVHVIERWEAAVHNLSQSRKKNNHNISTLETLFSEMDSTVLEDIAIDLVEEFANFVLIVSKNNNEENRLLRYQLDVVKTNISNDENVQNSLKFGRYDRTMPPSYKLLSIFSSDVHSGKEEHGNYYSNHWMISVKYDKLIDSFKKVLKNKYPNRREQIYTIFADYVFAIFSSVYIINYSNIFFEVYNKANQVVIFEGADNLGKSTLIENIIDSNINKFYNSRKLEKTNNGSLEKIKGEGISSNCSAKLEKINKCTLKFHGYPVYKKINDDKPKLSYIQYFSKYKHLPEGDIYARQFANLHNIVTCTMEKMEEFFTSPYERSLSEYKKENDDVVLILTEQINHERILLQDRSVLSTLIYSLKKDEGCKLTNIMQNYLNYQYHPFKDTRLRIIGTECPIHPDFKLETGNFGPLDFLNVYESMLNDKTIISNSKLHPGCANFIRSKFVFLKSDTPFIQFNSGVSNKTKNAITKRIPETLENVLNGLKESDKKNPLIEYEELNKNTGEVTDVDYNKLAKDVWEKTGMNDWKIRNQNYKSIYQAYQKNRIYEGKKEYSVREPFYDEKFVNSITDKNNENISLNTSEINITVNCPRNMIRFRKDDVSVYDPKDYTKWELADLVSQTIFN